MNDNQFTDTSFYWWSEACTEDSPTPFWKSILFFFFILKFYFLRQLFTFIKTKEKNRGWAKGVFLLPDPKYAVELVGKNRLILLCPENCCWNTTCLLILLSLASPLPQLLQLWVTSEVRCARDVNSHRHPCTKEFLAYANRDQSRGNLKYSLKDAEITRLLLIFFSFATVLRLLERHTRFTCPTKVHVLVQQEFLIRATQLWSVFTQTLLLGMVQIVVILWSN